MKLKKFHNIANVRDPLPDKRFSIRKDGEVQKQRYTPRTTSDLGSGEPCAKISLAASSSKSEVFLSKKFVSSETTTLKR